MWKDRWYWTHDARAALPPAGCGLTAILNAIDGYFWRSYWFLFASAILDGLDGHAARALKVPLPLLQCCTVPGRTVGVVKAGSGVFCVRNEEKWVIQMGKGLDFNPS